MSGYYTVQNPEPRIPIVANIPHSSTHVPAFARPGLKASPQLLQLEMARLNDWYTDELYSAVAARGGCALTFGANRLVLDPERYEDDAQEIMSKQGMGVIYTRGTHGDELRGALDPAQREELLSKLYRPYHAELDARVRWVLQKFGRCLVLDCHSFPAKTLPYEIDQNLQRPPFCFGTDAYHSPEPLVQAFENVVTKNGLTSLRNEPFAGTIVPLSLYRDSRVASIMIEINRALYMDESATEKSSGFGPTKAIIDELVAVAEQTF